MMFSGHLSFGTVGVDPAQRGAGGAIKRSQPVLNGLASVSQELGSNVLRGSAPRSSSKRAAGAMGSHTLPEKQAWVMGLGFNSPECRVNSQP